MHVAQFVQVMYSKPCKKFATSCCYTKLAL